MKALLFGEAFFVQVLINSKKIKYTYGQDFKVLGSTHLELYFASLLYSHAKNQPPIAASINAHTMPIKMPVKLNE